MTMIRTLTCLCNTPDCDNMSSRSDRISMLDDECPAAMEMWQAWGYDDSIWATYCPECLKKEKEEKPDE